LRSSLGWRRGAAQGLAAEFQAVSVVDEAVEDGVGVGGHADDGVPVGDRQLAGDDGGAPAVAIFEDLQQVVVSTGAQD
jgi:hypothetical protein